MIFVLFPPTDLFQKLPLSERPLLLRLIAGPDPEQLSFVLKENETGEVEVRKHTYVYTHVLTHFMHLSYLIVLIFEFFFVIKVKVYRMLRPIPFC